MIDGGAGDDTIKVTSGAKHDASTAATATTRSPRSSPAAARPSSCGPGIDTVIESEYAGNRKLVKIAGDCEKPQRARLKSGTSGGASEPAIAISREFGIDIVSVFVTQ